MQGAAEVEEPGRPVSMIREDGRLAAKSVLGQGGRLPREVVEISFRCLTHSWMPHLVRGVGRVWSRECFQKIRSLRLMVVMMDEGRKGSFEHQDACPGQW